MPDKKRVEKSSGRALDNNVSDGGLEASRFDDGLSQLQGQLNNISEKYDGMQAQNRSEKHYQVSREIYRNSLKKKY